jgi:REP-associated tyrosine transposase
MAYVGKGALPEFVCVTEVLGHFGRRLAPARRRYAEFLAEGAAKGVPTPWAKVAGQLLLGERRWVERMKRRVHAHSEHEEVIAAEALRPRPPLSVVITQVCRAAGLDQQALRRARGDRGGWARPVAMALA